MCHSELSPIISRCPPYLLSLYVSITPHITVCFRNISTHITVGIRNITSYHRVIIMYLHPPISLCAIRTISPYHCVLSELYLPITLYDQNYISLSLCVENKGSPTITMCREQVNNLSLVWGSVFPNYLPLSLCFS